MSKRLCALLLLGASVAASAQGTRRKVILDQDSVGPGGSNMLSMLLALQSPDVEVLGITVESGDGWQDEDVAHALRMLELVGRTDVPVYRGSTYPLVNSMESMERWEGMYGKIPYKGAWMKEWLENSTQDPRHYHAPEVVPPMKEGEPKIKAAEGTAAEFLVREARKYPGEITIMAMGPLTNVALAVRLDDAFAANVKDLYWMGASLNPMPPKRDEYALEYLFSPRMNFNVRWDPEAAKISLRAGFKRIVIVPTDATTETKFTPEMLETLKGSMSPAAKYAAKYPSVGMPLWDELTVAVWLDPRLIANSEKMSLDVNTDSGSAGYGETLTWRPGKGPGLGEPVVDAIRAVHVEEFDRMFLTGLMREMPQH